MDTKGRRTALGGDEVVAALTVGNHIGTTSTAGNRLVAVLTEDKGQASAEASNHAVAATTGDGSSAVVEGVAGVAVATGHKSSACVYSFDGLPPGIAAATGNESTALADGSLGVAVATGRNGTAQANEGSLAVSFGTAIGSLGSWLVIVEYKKGEGDEYPSIVGVKSALIDGDILKQDTTYMLRAGEFVAV